MWFNAHLLILAVLLFVALQSCNSLAVQRRTSIAPTVTAAYHQQRIIPTQLHRFARLYASRSPSGAGGGATKLDSRTVQKTAIKPALKEEIEKNYRLILHDDTVHTIQQVCDIVSATCPLCTGPRAYEVTLEVHMTGAGTICVANKKLVTEYTKALQAAGLTVSMAPDDEFEPSEDDEEE